MKNTLFYALLFAFATFSLTSCDPDDEIEDENEEELITTVQVQLTSAAETASLTFRDADGPGGNDPIISGATLRPNTAYNFSTTFLNESESPVEDITEEVREEGTDHFVLYTSGALNFNFVLSDMDTDGNPIGLTGTMTTGDAGTGDLQVVLRHEPTKTATGATGGETDVDVLFPIVVE